MAGFEKGLDLTSPHILWYRTFCRTFFASVNQRHTLRADASGYFRRHATGNYMTQLVINNTLQPELSFPHDRAGTALYKNRPTLATSPTSRTRSRSGVVSQHATTAARGTRRPRTVTLRHRLPLEVGLAADRDEGGGGGGLRSLTQLVPPPLPPPPSQTRSCCVMTKAGVTPSRTAPLCAALRRCVPHCAAMCRSAVRGRGNEV